MVSGQEQKAPHFKHRRGIVNLITRLIQRPKLSVQKKSPEWNASLTFFENKTFNVGLKPDEGTPAPEDWRIPSLKRSARAGWIHAPIWSNYTTAGNSDRDAKKS